MRVSDESQAALRNNLRCIVLLYHHVGQRSTGAFEDLTIAPDEFKRQMAWLAQHGYTGIRPAEWLEYTQTGKSLPAKPILITFDDAYADIAEHALPVLRRFGFGGAVFVVSGCVGRTNVWDEQKGYASLPLMNAEQLRYWAGQGIEFGAHSRTHPDLTGLEAGRLRDEVAGSRVELEGLLGRNVASFAYPHGAVNDTVVAAVQREYALGFTCVEGFNRAETDPLRLRRVFMRPGLSMGAFALTVRTGGLPRLGEWRIRLALGTRLRRILMRA